VIYSPPNQQASGLLKIASKSGMSSPQSTPSPKLPPALLAREKAEQILQQEEQQSRLIVHVPTTAVGGGEQTPAVVGRKRLSEELEPVSHIINVDAVFGVRKRKLCVPV
jgi:hypothetical protein